MKLTGFRGVNNSDATERHKLPDRVDPLADLSAGVNVDLDDTGKPSRRDGFTLLAAGKSHSLWPKSGETRYLVHKGDLCSLRNDVVTVLLPGVGDAPMYFDLCDGVPYFSNGAVIGRIVRGAVESFTAPAHADKEMMPACSHLTYYKGALWGAIGDTLIHSDPLRFWQWTPEKNFRYLPGDIELIAPALDGLYIAAGGATYFMQTEGPGKPAPLMQVMDCGAKGGTRTEIDGVKLKKDGIQGKLPMWASDDGVVVGLPGGQIINLTINLYEMPAGKSGGATIRTITGGTQYLVTLR